LRLRNFGKAIKHSNNAISINPKYIKAYFRKAKALIALKKYKMCVETC